MAERHARRVAEKMKSTGFLSATTLMYHDCRIVPLTGPRGGGRPSNDHYACSPPGGVLVKQRASLTKPVVQKRRFWIRPVVVRFGDRHPFPLAAAGMSHTLRVPGEGFATPVFKLDASDPDVSQLTAAEEHYVLGLTGRGGSA
ncbi:hypothetical protein CORC01_03303 [Colletotrichum orchidophilum]|uniref:Uncharacterized protein n=1 Tax=Colletotrichum orchidophilum TaxID=1209926 RepID=A0A1G4BIE5_9PEZI|nr:uncharacterized protein CORC01_03303 [Colletotrichum orchidophilum]OHF01270.1 hypothetical protein CORC01_03303 [Colletotrichum orchidophilum]